MERMPNRSKYGRKVVGPGFVTKGAEQRLMKEKRAAAMASLKEVKKPPPKRPEPPKAQTLPIKVKTGKKPKGNPCPRSR